MRVGIVSPKVVDASALSAILFREDEAAWMSEVLECGELHAPMIIDFELTNILLKKVKRAPSERDRLLAGFGLLARFKLARHPIEAAEVFGLAEQTRLSAYDASYLWLARRFGATLVTLDRRLAAAADSLSSR